MKNKKSKANAVQQIINQTHKEIDAMVYALYELTEEEDKDRGRLGVRHLSEPFRLRALAVIFF